MVRTSRIQLPLRKELTPRSIPSRPWHERRPVWRNWYERSSCDTGCRSRRVSTCGNNLLYQHQTIDRLVSNLQDLDYIFYSLHKRLQLWDRWMCLARVQRGPKKNRHSLELLGRYQQVRRWGCSESSWQIQRTWAWVPSALPDVTDRGYDYLWRYQAIICYTHISMTFRTQWHFSCRLPCVVRSRAEGPRCTTMNAPLHQEARDWFERLLCSTTPAGPSIH